MLSEMERDGYFDATGYHKWADLKCNMDPAVSIATTLRMLGRSSSPNGI